MNKRTLIYLLMLMPLLVLEVYYLVMGLVTHSLSLAKVFAGIVLLATFVWMALNPEKAMWLNGGPKKGNWLKTNRVPIPERFHLPFYACMATWATSIACMTYFAHPVFDLIFCLCSLAVLVCVLIISFKTKSL